MAQKEQVLIVPFPHNNKSLPGLPGNINIFPESDIYTRENNCRRVQSYSIPHSFLSSWFATLGGASY